MWTSASPLGKKHPCDGHLLIETYTDITCWVKGRSDLNIVLGLAVTLACVKSECAQRNSHAHSVQGGVSMAAWNFKGFSAGMCKGWYSPVVV